MLWEELIQKDHESCYPVDFWVAYFENPKHPDWDFPNFDLIHDYFLIEMNYVENKDDEEFYLRRFQRDLIGWIPAEVRSLYCREMSHWIFWHVYINYTHNPNNEETE